VNETHVTFIGNVATDIRSTNSRDGVPIVSFRLASTTRRFERGKGWCDVDTIFVTIVCWRHLAEHVASSFTKGDPVIVTGRLRMRQWTADDGRSGTAVEMEAVAAGHDLSRGTGAFTRTAPRSVERDGRMAADELAAAVAREPLDSSTEADRDAGARDLAHPSGDCAAEAGSVSGTADTADAAGGADTAGAQDAVAVGAAA